MSHDSEAAYASSEIAGLIMNNASSFFGSIGKGGNWSVYAGREGNHQWPLTDGVIQADNTSGDQKTIAFEYKRPNEGLHGILTALGQSFSYLEKGYDASIMAIPQSYPTYSSPGEHIKKVIEATAPDIPICVYTYSPPDLSATRPFFGHLTCVRDIDLSVCRTINHSSSPTAATSGSVSTLWAHMREGMSHPDAFFKYCESVKFVTSLVPQNYSLPLLPADLRNAVSRLQPNADPYKYLSSTVADSISDRAWRHVWFTQYFWEDLIPIFKSTSPYVVNDTPTKILIDVAGNQQKLFSGRSDSIKEKLVKKLNMGTITESQAWEMYAKKVRSYAHSYREVIDSGLFHIGFLDSDGSLTDLGYKFVDACERVGNAYSGIPMEILKGAILQNGQYATLLHYIYKLSEDEFDNNFYAFTKTDSKGNRVFDNNAYLSWLDNEFSNNLHLSKKTTIRAGGTRKPLQAELFVLKKYGFVRTDKRYAKYKIGSGLEIDWPQIQNCLLYFQSIE